MRALMTLLLLAMVAMSGCLSDDDPPADDVPQDGAPDEPTMEAETEDFGLYELEIATGHCHLKDYTEVVPGQVYSSDYNGGTGEMWLWQEANGVPGLQIEDNGLDPTGLTGALGVDSRCTDGDQLVV